MGPASGFTVNDYTPANAVEQQCGCENSRAWTESHLPTEIASSTELPTVLPNSAGKVTF